MAPNSNIILFPGTNTGTGTSPTGGGSPPPGTDPLAWTRQQVWAIRYHQKYNDDQRRRLLHNFITSQENSKTARGAFIRTTDHRAYLFDGRFCKLYKIDEKDPEFCGYLIHTYGLNASEQFTRHLIASLRHGTIAQGLLRDVRRFSYWDAGERILYISRYDGSCYAIDGEEIKIRPNGYGPSIFLDDDGGYNCDTPEKTGPEVGNHHELFRQLIDDLQYAPATTGGMSPEIQKLCLGVWLFAIAFPDLMPTKPILLVEGAPGSGKTFAVQRIAQTLHGKSTPLTIAKKEDPDFGIKILRSAISIIDDVNKPVEWLQDTLCTYATGGAWTRRRLFSDDGEHVIKPRAFLAITTNNPTTFRQGQVADRCLIIRLERRADKDGYTSANQLNDRISYWRPELQGEWLFWLNEIVRELRQPQDVTPSKYRMADFAHLAHVIGRVLNQIGGPSGDWSPDAVDEMLACMQHEREALVIEGDVLIELLDQWLDTESNQGREIKAADLHRELCHIAKTNDLPIYKSARALAARIRETGDALSTHFEISRRTGHGGVMSYVFRRT